MDRLAQLGELVQRLEDDRDGHRAAVHVGLHSNGIVRHAGILHLLQKAEEGIARLRVGEHAELVDDQHGARICFLRPADRQARLIEHGHPGESLPVRGLVHHVPDIYQAFVAGNDGPDPLLDEALYLLVVFLRKPLGNACVVAGPDERMALRGDAVVPAPPGDLLRILVSRLPLLRLEPRPIEGDGRVVQEALEQILVLRVFLCGRETVEHVDVAAEQEVVGELLGSDRGSFDRPAAPVYYPDDRVALPVLLGVSLDAGREFCREFTCRHRCTSGNSAYHE